MAAELKLGRLITLEGIEGAGKSSQMQTIQAVLQDSGLKCLMTREPGGTEVAEAIRSILIDGGSMPAMTELLLMFAARSSHLSEVIRPALAAGQWVICDRYVDASFAYQGAGRGIGEAAVASLEKLVVAGTRPDLVLVFDLPVEAGMQRVQDRGGQNRFDQESRAFMQRVRDCYLERTRLSPQSHVLIDASADFDSVARQLRQHLTDFVQRHAR